MSNNYLNLYKQDLIDHSKNPRNYGLLPTSDFFSSEYNPSCGDSIKMCGNVVQGCLTEVRFEGSGCVLSVAMASKLTEFARGMLVSEIMNLDEAVVEQLLGTRLGLNRLRCGLLSVMALQKGVGVLCEVSTPLNN